MKSNLEGRTVLVTGANGFLARTTIRELDRRGARIIATSIEDRPMYSMPFNVVGYKQADFTDKDSVRELFARYPFVDDIVHHASLFSLYANPRELSRVNVLGTGHLFEAAVKGDVERVVLTSSGTVYKAQDGLAMEDDPDGIGPAEPYGKSKFAQEAVTNLWIGEPTKSGKLRCGVVRPAVIGGLESKYGGKTAKFTHFLMQCLFQGLTAVPGDGTTPLCFVHVEDCANLHLYMLENDLLADSDENFPNYIFNSVDVGFSEDDPRPINNNDLADLVLAELNLPRYRSLLAGRKLSLPEKPLKWLSKYNDKLMNWLKKNNLPVPTVSLDSGSVDLMYVGDVSMSTQKAIDAGFRHQHPYTKEWMGQLIRQSIDTNWENLLGPHFKWLARLIK